jgi:hypothetical protein
MLLKSDDFGLQYIGPFLWLIKLQDEGDEHTSWLQKHLPANEETDSYGCSKAARSKNGEQRL